MINQEIEIIKQAVLEDAGSTAAQGLEFYLRENEVRMVQYISIDDFIVVANILKEHQTKLTEARKYAANNHYEDAAHGFINDNYFASHVTDEQIKKHVQKQLDLAKRIESGLMDNNATVAQNIHYYLTGECLPILP